MRNGEKDLHLREQNYCNIMLSFIIWIIGVVLTIKAAIEIWGISGDAFKKIVFIVLLLLTSWIGLAVYYLFAKKRIAGWVK